MYRLHLNPIRHRKDHQVDLVRWDVGRQRPKQLALLAGLAVVDLEDLRRMAADLSGQLSGDRVTGHDDFLADVERRIRQQFGDVLLFLNAAEGVAVGVGGGVPEHAQHQREETDRYDQLFQRIPPCTFREDYSNFRIIVKVMGLELVNDFGEEGSRAVFLNLVVNIEHTGRIIQGIRLVDFLPKTLSNLGFTDEFPGRICSGEDVE